MLGARCAATDGIVVLNRRRAGPTIVLLRLFLLRRLRFPADAPSESQFSMSLLLMTQLLT